MKAPITPDCQLLVSAEQAAQLCGVSRSTFLSWDSGGLCPRSIRLGGRVLWSRISLERWSASGCPSRETFERVEGHHDG